MSYYNASTVKYSRAQLQWGLCDRRCRLRLPVVARDHSALLEGARLLCHLATLRRAGARRTCVQVKGHCPRRPRCPRWPHQGLPWIDCLTLGGCDLCRALVEVFCTLSAFRGVSRSVNWRVIDSWHALTETGLNLFGAMMSPDVSGVWGRI